MELWRYPANGVGDGKQLTKNAFVLRQRFWPSPDGKSVLHADKDRRLYLLNLASGEDREIDRSAFDQHEEVIWSPDSRWIVMEKTTANSFSGLTLVEISTGRKTTLTSDRYHARDASFSPDGEMALFSE